MVIFDILTKEEQLLPKRKQNELTTVVFIKIVLRLDVFHISRFGGMYILLKYKIIGMKNTCYRFLQVN